MLGFLLLALKNVRIRMLQLFWLLLYDDDPQEIIGYKHPRGGGASGVAVVLHSGIPNPAVL